MHFPPKKFDLSQGRIVVKRHETEDLDSFRADVSKRKSLMFLSNKSNQRKYFADEV